VLFRSHKYLKVVEILLNNPVSHTNYNRHLSLVALAELTTMPTTDELACTYSALILVDEDIPITAEKIITLLKAANVQFEPIWPSLFARALSGINLKDLITKVGTSAAAGPPAPAAAAPVAAPAPEPEKKEEKKEEKKREEDEDSDEGDMGFGLFD